MQISKIRSRIMAGALSFVFLVLSVAGAIPASGIPAYSEAATASYQEDEYKSEVTDYLESVMTQELRAYFSGSIGKKVKMTTISDDGYKTKITFYFEPAKIAGIDTDTMMGYLYEIIAANPNFCTLSTTIIWSPFNGELSVSSVVAKSKQAEAITEYKSFLADIERVPFEAESMSDIEILLYLHDALIQQADYSRDTSSHTVFVPYYLSKTGKSVCQSYAAVLNNLMRDLGFTCYILTSDTHEWNVVKLDGKWTCIDVTWDDPSGNEKDYALHENFLVKLSSFNSAHKLEDVMSTRFRRIAKKAENEFEVLPKSDKLCHPVCYKSGIWFYADGGTLYRWDGVSQKADIEAEVPEDYMRCVGVINGTVYIGGSDGLFTYDPDARELTRIKKNVEVCGMYYFGKTLYYDVGGVWKKCASVKTPYTSYEYLNGTLNSIRVSLTVPTSPVIKIMKSSAKSIRVRVTGGAEGANGGYQIQYSTDPNFSSYKKKTVTGISSSLTGLKKGVKYYVRVRGIYRRDEYLAKYGKWSAVKKA